MTATEPIALEPMQAKYNPQASRLLVHGFRGKFQHLTNKSDDELALFFERLLDRYPTEPASLRMVAVQDGVAVGTISVKWRSDPDGKGAEPRKQSSSLWKELAKFGKWYTFKMLLGLYMLDYQPRAGECYIADVVVHPDYRGQGVGKLLLQWAREFAEAEPGMDRLSLFVSGKNPRAKQLYEQLSFRTEEGINSLTKRLLFDEMKWDYMVSRVK